MVKLLQILDERGSIDLNELTVLLDASAATIRRDVAKLADQGLVSRMHGGVCKLAQRIELPLSLRDKRNSRAKKAIAHEVGKRIPAGQHILALNGGTTISDVLDSVAHRKDLTIVTNSVSLALEAAEHGQTRVLVTGGVLRYQSLEMVGSLAEHTFQQVSVGTAVLGSDGVSAEGGVTTYDQIEANTNNAMIRSAQNVIAVADGSKIGEVQAAQSAKITDIDLLVTDSSADPAEIAAIRRKGVQVIVVPVHEDAK